MRQLVSAGFVGVLVLGCAELLPSTDPGTPGGGPFCSTMPDRTKACYPTEEERARAYHAAIDELNRPANEAAKADAERQEVARKAEWEREKEREQQAAEDAKAARAAKAQEIREQIEAEERQKADAAAAVHKMALDKAYAVPAISAIMCSIDEELVGLREQLAREKRVAAIGGVASLTDRHKISSDIVDNTDELTVWRASLKRYDAPRLPCKEVAGIAKCRENGLKDCSDSALSPATVWAQELETLWGSDRPHPSR